MVRSCTAVWHRKHAAYWSVSSMTASFTLIPCACPHWSHWALFLFVWELWECFMLIWGHRIKHLIIIQYCHASYLGTEFMLFVVILGELNVFEHMPPPCGLSRIMQTHSQMCLVHWCSVEAITATIIVLYLCDFFNSIPKEKVPRRCWNTILSSHKTGWDLFVWKWNSFIYTMIWHEIAWFSCAVSL